MFETIIWHALHVLYTRGMVGVANPNRNLEYLFKKLVIYTKGIFFDAIEYNFSENEILFAILSHFTFYLSRECQFVFKCQKYL